MRACFLALASALAASSAAAQNPAIDAKVDQELPSLVSTYKALHAAPELPHHEDKTAALLANELRGRNVTVNAVAPGPVATELFLNDKTQAQIEQLSKLPPLERLGQPEDIANVVSFLAGPDGGWVNGQVLRINGGFA